MIISNRSELPAQALSLPEGFIIPEKRPKRRPQPVDFDIFGVEQRIAVEAAINYIDGKMPDARMLLITGFAGTGKTFLVGKLQDYLLYARKLKVAVTTPTNKAVQVSKDLCDISHDSLTFSTIYKLLGLKDSYDDQGRLKFIPDPMSPPSLEGYDVLFVDESSMLNDDLFHLIEPFIEQQDLKIIFIGDPAQIPPVGRFDCIPFIKAQQLKYGIKVFGLTEIRRQANGSPLLDFATEIRAQRMNSGFEYDYRPVVVGDMGFYPISAKAKDLIYEICAKYFINDIFSQYPDFMKVIAWRNVAVDAANKKIRQMMYKLEIPPKLMHGEKMIADDPIKSREGVIINTNAEFSVVDYNIKSTKHVSIHGNDVICRDEFKFYETTISTHTDRGPRRLTVNIIHEDSEKAFKVALETISTYAFQRFGGERKGIFKDNFYALKNSFASVKYNYAITAHKSQGSTYENCMILEWDMDRNVKVQERNRIRYVAATRARKNLFIIK